jgi:hypothetical protein
MSEPEEIEAGFLVLCLEIAPQFFLLGRKLNGGLAAVKNNGEPEDFTVRCAESV